MLGGAGLAALASSSSSRRVPGQYLPPVVLRRRLKSHAACTVPVRGLGALGGRRKRGRGGTR